MKQRTQLFTHLLLPTFVGLLITAWAGAQDATPSCDAPAGNQKTKTKADAAPVQVGVKQLIADRATLDGKKVQLEGMVTEICKHRGCWAMLHDVDSDAEGQIRVKQDDNQSNFKAFMPEHQGRTVLVTGELHVTKIDKAYLDKWEARVKAAGKKGAAAEEAEQSQEAVLKQIAALREKLAKSGKPYLSSMQVAVDKWQVKKPSS
jgi:hypothetical protein